MEIDPQVLRQASDRRKRVPRLQSTGGNPFDDLVNQLCVNRGFRLQIELYEHEHLSLWQLRVFRKRGD
ncbi:hypothetical protein D3C75_1124910 [compost metagenome]